jgi:peptidoglycan/LPS O-acetylase OafA/YrhL
VYLYYFVGFTYDPWLYRFFPTELVFFLFGNLSYKMYTKFKNIDLAPVLGKLGLIVILLLTFTYQFVPYTVVMFLYFLLFFLAIPFVFQLSKSWKYDRWIGELSYPIYISHMMIIVIVTQLPIPKYGGYGFVVLVGTLILAVLLNKFVAEKIEKVRQRRVK